MPRERLTKSEKDEINSGWRFTEFYKAVEEKRFERGGDVYSVELSPQKDRSGRAIVFLDEESDQDPYTNHLIIWPELSSGQMSDTLLLILQSVAPNPDDDFDFKEMFPELLLLTSKNSNFSKLEEIDVRDTLFSQFGHGSHYVDPIEATKFIGTISFDSLTPLKQK